MLSCECYEDFDSQWFYYHPNDFQILKTKRGRRCKSCNMLIKVGSICVEFTRERYPRNEIEDKIYGEGAEIPTSSWYHCERCGEIYFNLGSIGYCLKPNDDMQEALKEYWELIGFKPDERYI